MESEQDTAEETAARVAIVTGAAGGIGQAIMAEFIRAGIRVALWDRDQAALDQAANSLGVPPGSQPVPLDTGKLPVQIANPTTPSVLKVATDLTDEAAVAAAMRHTIEHMGRLDILVHCVGITGDCLPLERYTFEEWNRVVTINLSSAFLCARAAVPHLKRSPAGRIVFLASIAGKEGNANQAAYSASKAGIMALTKSLGKELAQGPVRVNCISPAIIETALLRQMTPEAIQASLSKIPMGRAGRPEEVAQMAAWLSSPACSFSTGATFDLSGGRATY